MIFRQADVRTQYSVSLRCKMEVAGETEIGYFSKIYVAVDIVEVNTHMRFSTAYYVGQFEHLVESLGRGSVKSAG